MSLDDLGHELSCCGGLLVEFHNCIINCSQHTVNHAFVNIQCGPSMTSGLIPSAIDSDSIEPLSVLHSKLKFER